MYKPMRTSGRFHIRVHGEGTRMELCVERSALEGRGACVEKLRRLYLIVMLSFFLCLMMAASAHATGEIKNKDYIRGSKSKTQIILVGDSCTFFMDFCPKSVKKGFVLLGVNGGQLGVIDRNGKIRSQLERYIRKYPKAAVVLALGKNGNGNPRANAKKCIRICKGLMKKFPKTKFFVASIIPNVNTITGSYSNSNIRKHAAVLKKKYKRTGRYIDLNEYLMTKVNNNFRKKVKGMPPQYGFTNALHLNRIGSAIALKYIRRCVKQAS